MVTIRSMLSKTTSSLAYYPGAVHPLTEGPGGIDLFLESLYHHPDSKQRHVCRDISLFSTTQVANQDGAWIASSTADH